MRLRGRPACYHTMLAALAVLALLAVASCAPALPPAPVILFPAEAAVTPELGLISTAAVHIRRILLAAGSDGVVKAAAGAGDVHAALLAAEPGADVILVTDDAHVSTLWAGVTPRCRPSTSDGVAVCVTGALVSVVGGSPSATLHAANTMLEQLYGVRFGIDGSVVPAAAVAFQARAAIGASFTLNTSPVFARRGLQPFHDFFSGPDWWSEDEYKRVLESLSLMKANFIGFHTYPIDVGGQTTGTNEPAVWIGPVEQVNADGTVMSAYPTAWASTLRPQWGMSATNSSAFAFGAGALFTYDCYGHPIQSGNASLCPFPVSAGASVDVINKVGELWQAVFPYAHSLGVQTCLGTEIPMTPPPPPTGARVPLNVYYSQSRQDHFATTTECAECVGLYTFLGIAGYVYTSPMDGATVPLTTYYNNEVTDNILLAGNTAPPPGYGFVRVEGYAAPTGGDLADLDQFVRTSGKTDHWAAAGAMAANASANPLFTNAGAIAQVWATGPPAPTTQSLYEGPWRL